MDKWSGLTGRTKLEYSSQKYPKPRRKSVSVQSETKLEVFYVGLNKVMGFFFYSVPKLVQLYLLGTRMKNCCKIELLWRSGC